MKKRLNKKGFTLIELIVVIAILGILAAVIIPRFGGFTDKARATQALTEAKQIATALDGYFAENNEWADPAVGTELGEVLVTAGLGAADGTITAAGSSFSTDITATGGFVWEVTVGGDTYRAGRVDEGAVEVQP